MTLSWKRSPVSWLSSSSRDLLSRSSCRNRSNLKKSIKDSSRRKKEEMNQDEVRESTNNRIGMET